MINAKESLVGDVTAKQNITGTLNTGIEKVYPELEDLTITPSNEEQHFRSEKYGYGNVTVEKISDEYVMVNGDIEITSNGTYDVTEKENAIVNIPEPTGTIDINTNGVFNVKDKEFANVNIPIKQLGTKTITQNGVYNATDDNLDGYSSVDVQTSGVDINDYFNFSNVENSAKLCFYIKNAPYFDTSGLTSLYGFFQDCRKLETIPYIDTSTVTDMGYMFYYAYALQEIPQIDTSKVTSIQYMFNRCRELKKLPQLDFSSVINSSSAFSRCEALVECGGFKNYGKAFDPSRASNYSGYKLDLTNSTNLTHDSLMNIINNLYDIASAGVQTQQLVLGYSNTIKLTNAEKAIANNKGWSIS